MATYENLKRGKDLTEFQRGRIFSLKFDARWSYTKISNHLQLNRSTVVRCCQRMRDNDNPEHNLRELCGNKKITSPRDERHIVRLCESDRFITAVQIQSQILPNVSAKTVQRRLISSGLLTYTPARKPKLNDRIRKIRNQWATNHKHWTIDDWARVTFSDESSFSVNTRNSQYVRRRVGERYVEKCLATRQNRSHANCMIWGAFSIKGYSPLYRVQCGTLNSERYQLLLKDVLLPSLHVLLPTEGLFQQDNAPPHSSRSTKEFLQQNGVNVLAWPTTSPVKNPIENVWGHMSRILRKNDEMPTDGDNLFVKLEEIWNKIMSNVQYRRDLISSMTDRVTALCSVSGGYTKY